MIVVLLGPPGAGKGTQAARLAATTGLTHISTGELFRAHLREGTVLGRQAQMFMSRGELVPDDVVVGMVRERIDAGGGFVLDGFPRTVAQAKALDDMVGEDLIVAAAIAVARPQLAERLTGRRVCAQEGHVYNLATSPPRLAGVCDLDGSPLVQREDDTDSMVARRLEVYRQETEPVLAYYAHAGRLHRVAGDGDADAVHDRLVQALDTPGSTP